MINTKKLKTTKYNLRLWIIFRTVYIIWELAALTLFEKWMDLSIGLVSFITTIYVIQNVLTIGLFIQGYQSTIKRIKFLLIGLIVTMTVGAIALKELPFWYVYLPLGLVAIFSYILIPWLTLVLSQIGDSDQVRISIAHTTRNKSLLQSLFLVICYFELHSFVEVQWLINILVITFIGIIVPFTVYFIPFFSDITLKSQKFSLSLSNFRSVPYYLVAMFIIYAIYRGVNPLNQQYVRDVYYLNNYESSMLYTMCYILGGFFVSFILTRIKKIKISYMFMCSGFAMLIYLCLLWMNVSVIILYLMMIILGGFNYGTTNYITIYVQNSYQGEELKYYTKLTYIIPFASAALALFVFGQLSGMGYMMLAYVIGLSTFVFIGNVWKHKQQ